MKFILHHYQASPFSEKVRAVFGFKQLDYHSVIIPPIMPKPDLTALTGGYRRTPVMQIGADIYCDTRLICRVIDQHQCAPALYPEAISAAAETLAQWADDHFFRIAVAVAFSPRGIEAFRAQISDEQMAAFMADRQKMATSGKYPSRRLEPDVAESYFTVYMKAFDGQFAKQDFIFGEPTIADFALYHCVWFVASNPGLASVMEPYAHIRKWMDRIKGFGQGSPREITAAQAVEIAQQAAPQTQASASVGDRISVIDTTLGIDPVEGRLVKLADDEIIIHRTSDRAGDIHVHYPRIGYQIINLEGDSS